jgi:hypothetical protein
MGRAATGFTVEIYDSKEELDRIMAETGLDVQYRLPVFLAFIRDKFFYEYMEKKDLFPSKKGLCPKHGEGNFYGAESFQPLHSKVKFGVTHAMIGPFSFVYIDPPYFDSGSLFSAWGFQGPWQAKETFARILKTVSRTKPTGMERIQKTFRKKESQQHIPDMVAYLASQEVLAASEGGYVNVSARLKRRTIRPLKELSERAAAIVAEFIAGAELAELYPKTAPGRNRISLAEFREAVAWQTIWATTGYLDEKGFFAGSAEDGRELYVFER